MRWEAATKLALMISLLAAAVLQNILVAQESPLLAFLSGFIFVGVILAARRYSRLVLFLLLLFLYVLPAVIFLIFQTTFFFNIFSVGLLGFLLSTSNFKSWHQPPEWKIPLILWSLVVALSWPIVLLRELDFAPALTLHTALLNSGQLPVASAASWILNITLAQGVGFLWIDWLFAAFYAKPVKNFQKSVILPLSFGFLVTALVSFFQVFINIHALNTPYWIRMGRATGTLMDANPYGVLSACWGPAVLILMLISNDRRRLIFGSIAMILSWLCVLFSGSRSGLIISALCSVYILWLGIREALKARKRSWLIAGTVAIFLAICLAWLVVPSNVETPLERIGRKYEEEGSLPKLIRSVLWDRIVYAEAAAHMIQKFPVSGVGIGSLNILMTDYPDRVRLKGYLPFDNALNWYLHQFAELGILGSIGWISWLVVFTYWLFKRSGEGVFAIPAGILKSVLVTFGIASLVGVHDQRLEVLLTFWSFVFWLSVCCRQSKTMGPTGPSDSRLHAAVVALVVVYVVSLGLKSVAVLAVPYRAARAGRDYSYGFYGWENEAGKDYRWTHEKAVSVIPVEGPLLQLTMWTNQPDVSQKPVHVSIWVDNEQATELWMYDRLPVTSHIQIPGRTHVALTVKVSSTWRPSDYGQPDLRRLGVAVGRWKFLQLSTGE